MSYLFAFSYCSWGSQDRNTEVACHSLLHWTMFSQNSLPPLIDAIFKTSFKLYFKTTKKAVLSSYFHLKYKYIGQSHPCIYYTWLFSSTIFILKFEHIEHIKRDKLGTSLHSPGLRLCTPNAGGLCSIPCQGARPHMLQQKIPHAATNTWYSQNK